MENLPAAEESTLPPPASAAEVKPTVAKAKPTQTKRKGRKAVKKKPDDMPRRPLSAYNFFFSVSSHQILFESSVVNTNSP